MAIRKVTVNATHLEILFDLASAAAKQGTKASRKDLTTERAYYEVASWLRAQATAMRDHGDEIEIDDDTLTGNYEVRNLYRELLNNRETLRGQIDAKNRESEREARASRIWQATREWPDWYLNDHPELRDEEDNGKKE